MDRYLIDLGPWVYLEKRYRNCINVGGNVKKLAPAFLILDARLNEIAPLRGNGWQFSKRINTIRLKSKI
jgi:hypothetical protein